MKITKNKIVLVSFLLILFVALYFAALQKKEISKTILDFQCGDSINYAGNSYATVKIEGQCWFAENLKNVKDAQNKSIKRYCYENNSFNCDIYGGLYEWVEIMKEERADEFQGICPNGWRVPSDSDWKKMEKTLGLAESEIDSTGWRSSGEVGKKLKEKGFYPDGYWANPNDAENSSGFSARGGGVRYLEGSYNFLNFFGGWWSSTEYDENHAWVRFLKHDNEGIDYTIDNKNVGLSVRCVLN